jgi:tRNA pseudouridine38-40 synthase
VWPEVELERMQKAAEHLVGSHDFSSFGSPPRIGGKTIRNVFHAVWNEDQEDLVFEIVANAFLFRMVRRLVSIQVLVGQGVLEPEEVLKYLETKSPSYVKGLAPPQGLTLMEVIYSA